MANRNPCRIHSLLSKLEGQYFDLKENRKKFPNLGSNGYPYGMHSTVHSYLLQHFYLLFCPYDIVVHRFIKDEKGQSAIPQPRIMKNRYVLRDGSQSALRFIWSELATLPVDSGFLSHGDVVSRDNFGSVCATGFLPSDVQRIHT